MSPRVYRPLAALVLGLLFGGLFAWFTKGRGGDDPLRGFALIHARGGEMTAEFGYLDAVEKGAER